MLRFDPSDQSRPVMHLGEHALYAPHVIALGYVVTMLLTACEHRSPSTRQVVWAPGGSTAAVIAADGLYLSDPAGVLSPLLARTCTWPHGSTPNT